MPLFEYVCLNCGAEFERLVLKSSEEVRGFCPACNSPNLEEKVSSFASVSKGGSSLGGASDCTPAGG
jgi:putative FmdB family regulatory protein